ALAVAPEVAGLGLLGGCEAALAGLAVERFGKREGRDATGLGDLEDAVVEGRSAAIGAGDFDRALADVDLGAVLDDVEVERDERARARELDEHLATDGLSADALARHRRRGRRGRGGGRWGLGGRRR